MGKSDGVFDEGNCGRVQSKNMQVQISRIYVMAARAALLAMLSWLASMDATLGQAPQSSTTATPQPGGVDVPSANALAVSLRSRNQTFKGSPEWDAVTVQKTLNGRETAVIICDMWDTHWCHNAATRCDALAKKMAPVLAALRARGVTVIHAPSDCMDFYKDAPQRRRMLAVPKFAAPKPLAINDPPLPIDDSDGGSDDATPTKPYKAWTRENPAIPIAENDFISESGDEVYSLLHERGITNLLVMGVHANICVLNRPFAIKQMTRWGIHCILVRDLTDALYNPKMRPFVSHEAGTELVIEHIEKYWCPSVASADLMQKPTGQ